MQRTTARRLVVVVVVLAASAMLVALPAVGHDPSPEQIDATVADVLSGDRYTGLGQDPISQFLASNPVSRWIADRIDDFLEWLASLGADERTRQPRERVEEDRSSGLSLLAAFLILLVIVGALALSRRREAWDELDELEADPIRLPESELLRLADEAEARGDFEAAVRYRFQAGLKGLDRLGHIEAKETTSTGAVRRQVALAEFDDVATSFEVATYSEYTATTGDAERARAGWAEVFRTIRPEPPEDEDE